MFLDIIHRLFFTKNAVFFILTGFCLRRQVKSTQAQSIQLVPISEHFSQLQDGVYNTNTA
jgi:hypothetical protein